MNIEKLIVMIVNTVTQYLALHLKAVIKYKSICYSYAIEDMIYLSMAN